MLPARVAIVLVRAYQVLLRPLFPPACRFEPSCSEYCRQALASHGLLRGVALAIRRLGRCHPWDAGGYDPPPLPEKIREEKPGV